MSHDPTLAALWQRIERVVDRLDDSGLRPPATNANLDALRFPVAWRGLYLRHDGQSDALDGLFDSWFFLPLRGPVDSVEAESDDDHWVIAKDFGGGVWAIERRNGALYEVIDGESRQIARDLNSLMARVADAIEKSPPLRWVPGPDGQKRLETVVDAEVRDLADWPIGEPRPLAHGVVALRIASPPPGPLPEHGFRLHVLVGHPHGDVTAKPITGRLELPEGWPHPVADQSEGGLQAVESEHPVSPEALLKYSFDRRFLPRLESHVLAVSDVNREDLPSLSARGLARAAVGDVEGAISDLREVFGQGGLTGADTLVDLLLQTNDLEAARHIVPHLSPTADARMRFLLHADPAGAVSLGRARCAERGERGDHLWLALALERTGDFAGAAEATFAALNAHGSSPSEARVKAALDRRRKSAAMASSPKAISRAETEAGLLSTEATLEEGEWRAVVTMPAAWTTAGGVVDVGFPTHRHALRLPPGLQDGRRGRFKGVGPEGATLVLEIRLATS